MEPEAELIQPASEEEDEVVEVVERVSGTIEAAEDISSDSPKGTQLIQKKLENLEDKLENVVKMLVEVKERAKKENEGKRKELARLKENEVKLEEMIVEQGVEIRRLKERGESADKKSLSFKQGRRGNDQKLTAGNDLGWIEKSINTDENKYRGSEEEDEESWQEAVQVRTGGGGKCTRPDFRHQHSTTKAKKVNWEVDLPKAGNEQLKLMSPKSDLKIKDRAGGDKVNLNRLGQNLGNDLDEGPEPKVAKRARGVGFKVASLDGYIAGRVVCGKGKKHKAKACGKCEGCLRGNCGLCKFCLDKPCFGGNNVYKQKCLERACTDPQSTRCEACILDKNIPQHE